MHRMRRARLPRVASDEFRAHPPLLRPPVGPALAALTVRAIRRRHAGHEIEESRLYARRGRRLGAHLTRRSDGRRAVLALPLDGSHHTSVYLVDEHRPWHDFERQARLVGAAWGPCRDASAGL